MTPVATPKPVGELTNAVLLYTLLTIILTWPVAAHLDDAVPFYNDTWIFVWNVHYVRSALLDPTRSVYETNMVFHPDGISLAYHTMAPLYGALAVPLEGPLGLIRTYNLFVLSTFISSALAAWWLVRRLTGHSGAALFAGALFAFSPYHQAHMPHLNLLSLQFLPLVAVAADAFLQTAAWRHGVALAVLGALSFYACHEYALFAALLSALMLFWTAWTGERYGVKLAPLGDLLGRGVAVAALAIGLAAPGIVPMLAEAAIESHYAEPVDIDFSADVFSWFTPSVLHSLYGGYTMKVYQYFPGVLAEWTTFIGITVGLLCVLGVITKRHRTVGLWLLVAVVFGLLAMGPYVRILGQATAIPLPYAALKSLPVMSAMREPSRFAAGVTLATSVLAGFGFVAAQARVGRFVWLLLPIALFEFVQFPVPMSSARVPTFLHTLNSQPDDFAVLEVPSGLELREHLYHQAVHEKRIFLGYIARIPTASRRYIETEPLLTDPALWHLTDAKAAELARSAHHLGVRYALVYEAFYQRRQLTDRFEKAIVNLCRLPGTRLATREPGFAAIEFAVDTTHRAP